MKIRVMALVLWALSGSAPLCQAQLAAAGATAFINAIHTNLTGDLLVGTNGSFATRVITNIRKATNSGTGIIGENSKAKTNRILVTGAIFPAATPFTLNSEPCL
jgi:hypothetical protein